MLEGFRIFIGQNNLFDAKHKILLAVSGGIDSVVMADLFQKSEYEFAMAHCNFCLRAEESDLDEVFVKALAKKYDRPFYTKKFDTVGYAKEKGISTQMAARDIRYQWFLDLLQQQGYDFLATAHHKNDSLETILLNLAKGTGIAGMHGILPKNKTTVRPMLYADREMVRHYALGKKIAWREDSSNQSVKYKRNMIRHEIIPVLKKINPSLENTLTNTVEKLRAAENIFREKIDRVKEETFTEKQGEIWIDKTQILQEKECTIILYELIRRFGFNYSQTKNVIDKLSDSQGIGKQFESEYYQLNIDRQQIIISQKTTLPSGDIEIIDGTKTVAANNFRLTISKHSNSNYTILSDKNIAALDYNQLTFPLKLRKWQAGDWFIPLGMQQRKKLSDFLIDEKVSLPAKENVFVLTSDEKIAWVVGHRVDNRFKITANSKSIYQLENLKS